MRDELYRHYEEELSFIRRRVAEFATKHTAVAGRLLLEPGRSVDPHVERLIEAFAMIAARVRVRLDDEFPQLTDGLLEILQPHALAPVPSMTIARFELDPTQADVEKGVDVPRHTLVHTRKVDDVPCRFRTAFPLRLFPIAVDRVDWPAVDHVLQQRFPAARGALRLSFKALTPVPLAQFAIRSLRVYFDELDSTPGVAHQLHELLLAQALGMVVRVGEQVLDVHPASAIAPVGFGADEGVVEPTRQSTLGHRLLLEYFAFEHKFLFVELQGLDGLRRAGAAQTFELVFPLREPTAGLPDRVRVENFKLGCTPVVNSFPMTVSPIRLDHREFEYEVVPDSRARFAYEVHSLIDVSTTTPGTNAVRPFRPFYSVGHVDAGRSDVAYWHLTRRPSQRSGDEGTNVFIALVDPSLTPARIEDVDVLHVRALCTNRDLPSRLVLVDPTGDFSVEGMPAVMKIKSLRQATPSMRPDLLTASRWRLISHLALNHLSLGGPNGLAALQDILRLYDPGRTASTRQRIEGLVAVKSEPMVKVLPGRGAVRGLRIDLEFDESRFSGSGAFLFSAVLERFFALHASLNSFTMTRVRSRQRDRESFLKQWPPRLGERALI